jgi:hypothetical protein
MSIPSWWRLTHIKSPFINRRAAAHQGVATGEDFGALCETRQFHLGRAAYQRVLIIKIHQVDVCINIFIYIHIIMHVNVYRTNPHMHGTLFTPAAGHQEISLPTHQFRLPKGSGWFRHLSGILLSGLIWPDHVVFVRPCLYITCTQNSSYSTIIFDKFMAITLHYYTDGLIVLDNIAIYMAPLTWLSKAARLNLALTQQNNKCLDKARQTFQEGTRMAAWNKCWSLGAPRAGCRIWPGWLVGLMGQDVCYL